MFKALVAVILGGNPGSWAILALGAVIALGSASGLGAYAMHRMDAASYAELELKYANQRADSALASLAAQQQFARDLAAADKLAADLMATLADERAKHGTELLAAFKTAGANNAQLATCLRMPLPDGVLAKLAH
jgi:hypothetical protein